MPATPAQVKAAVTNALNTLWPKFVAAQTAYYASHNRYWQGIVTGTPPADGTTAALDKSRKPYYQAEDWNDLLGADLPASLPFAIECTQYKGPSGDGFVVSGWVTINGVVWMKAVGYGPEARDVAWTAVVSEPAS